MTFKYCYFADTNWAHAEINTRVDGELAKFGFNRPYTGAGECTKSDPNTYATHSFTYGTGMVERLGFEYKNGDYKVMIADILVEGTTDSPGYCESGPTEHHFSFRNADRDWENTIYDTSEWVTNLAWGGWETQYRYWSPNCNPDDVYRVIRPAFGFGFSGRNYVGGDEVMRFGGGVDGDTCDHWGCQGYEYSYQRHYAVLRDMRFFYHTPTDKANVDPYAAGLVGRPGEECAYDWTPYSTTAKAVLTVAAFQLPWLGFATLVPDKRCVINGEELTWNGAPGRGMLIKDVSSADLEQHASAFVNIGYGDALPGKFRPEIHVSSVHHVQMQACWSCDTDIDDGVYYYSVTPLLQVR